MWSYTKQYENTTKDKKNSLKREKFELYIIGAGNPQRPTGIPSDLYPLNHPQQFWYPKENRLVS